MMSAVEISGRWGLGDALMSRAVIRELMKTQTVYLRTPYPGMYRDLYEQGLKISAIPASPRGYEHSIKSSPGGMAITAAPRNTRRIGINYERDNGPLDIIKNGSILAAMFKSVGLRMPAQPDFSFAVPEPWRARARALTRKPTMVYRPLVVNRTFGPLNRLPDAAVYDTLFNLIRDQFFVASVARIAPGYEDAVAPSPRVDADFSHGELDFETLVGLFAEAALVFCTSGFPAFLAHAVKTPVVIVYGGFDTFAMSQAPTAALSPTLAIEPDHPCGPCGCQNPQHNCDKTITVPPAEARLLDFVRRLS